MQYCEFLTDSARPIALPLIYWIYLILFDRPGALKYIFDPSVVTLMIFGGFPLFMGHQIDEFWTVWSDL